MMRTIVVTLALAGCGVMPGAPGYISETTSRFDGGREISVSPGHASGCCSLGATWRSMAPTVVHIVAENIGSLVSIQDRGGLEFNIDGRVVKLDSTGHPTEFEATRHQGVTYRRSSKSFIMKRADFEAMLSAKLLKVRLNTAHGYTDGDLLESAYGGSAIQGFRAFADRLPK